MSFVSRTPEGHDQANWREPSGRQKAKTFRTKTEAKRLLAGIDGSLSRGLYVDPHAGRLLFATHALQWLDSRNDELATKARDASIMHTHVLPQWGTWPLSKIDHLSVQKWITELGTHRAPATVAEAQPPDVCGAAVCGAKPVDRLQPLRRHSAAPAPSARHRRPGHQP